MSLCGELELRAGFPEGLKVLLVEADQQRRENIQQQLEQCQYQVSTCESIAEAMQKYKHQEFEVVLIEMTNYLSQSDNNDISNKEFARSLAATSTPILLTAQTEQLKQAKNLINAGQQTQENYLPFQAVMEYPLDSLQIKNLWQHKVKCLLQNHGMVGAVTAIDDDKNAKTCEVSGTSIQDATTSGEGMDSEVTSIVRFMTVQGSGDLENSQFSDAQPSKQSSQPSSLPQPQPNSPKQRKRRIENPNPPSTSAKKPQLAYKVPFQLHPQPLLPSMPMGMFHPGWVPPPPAPGAVWGCPVPPGLCLGGHNLAAQALPPPLMIQHPFLGPAAALVVPSRKIQNQQCQKEIIAPAVMVPCQSGSLQQQQQQLQQVQQQQVLQQYQQQQQLSLQQKQTDFLECNLGKFFGRVESQQDLFSKNEIETATGLDLDLPAEEFDSLFYNPDGMEMDPLQQLLECDGGDMEMNRNCSFTHLERLA